jgi:serine/threonine protein kinase
MLSDTTLDQTGVIAPLPAPGAPATEEGSTGELAPDGRELPGTPLPANRREPARLSHYRLLRKIGQGGMGAVYLGEGERDGARVAVKVLAREAVPDEHAIRRFQKEARLLAEVRHPHVTNLLETGAENGICFLVMDFVEGTDLRGLLAKYGPLPERLALQIVRDVAEALAEAHRRGIVHRDIKPGNILLSAAAVGDERPAEAVVAAVAAGCKPLVKLTDFGLARHVEQSASMDLTRTGAMLGTPYFIAPEQCTDKGEVCPATDVYSLGATLFEMLTGRPPFVAAEAVRLISMHCFEEPPDLRRLNPSLSDGAARLVARTLQKSASARFANAAQLAAEVDRLLRGDTNDVEAHPAVPAATGGVIETVWEWDLASSPEQIWPLASNTERINCAVGVPAVEYSTERDAFGAIRKVGKFRMGWAELEWEEYPFEWVEGRRLGVLREFRKGPFQWFVSIVELVPRSPSGTRLRHTVRIAPRGFLGRLLARIEVNLKGRRALDRIYNRIDMVAGGRLQGSPALDPFEPPARVRGAAAKRFGVRGELLQQAGVAADCSQLLVQFLKESPAQELARIRPVALAKRLGVPADRLTEACLHGCHVGLLELHWDILCPTCRISSNVTDTLAEIDRHAHCEACDLDFDVDFGNAVELIFRVHPELRLADLKTYCIGGPEHAPHVVAQARLSAGESLSLELALDPGAYVLRGPQLPYTVPLAVHSTTGAAHASLPLSREWDSKRFPGLRAGHQSLTLENQYDRPILVRIERTIPRCDVLTATQASRLPLFAQLFPREVVSRDRLSDYAACTLLAVRAVNLAQLCDQWGEAAAYLKLGEQLRGLRQAIEARGGQVVREGDDQLLAAFPQTLSAVAAAFDLFESPEDDSEPAIRLRAALHRGTALATSVNGRLDYFGRAITTARDLLDAPSCLPLVLSDELAHDPEVVALLDDLRESRR